ncbi:MAG: hypothetical protein WDO73_32155 [Ignavibacteriota bacterium]
MQLLLAKADPKHNRFTLQVLATTRPWRSATAPSTSQCNFYLAGSRQPEEIVVNEVKKDEVVGYVSIPKVKMARR